MNWQRLVKVGWDAWTVMRGELMSYYLGRATDRLPLRVDRAEAAAAPEGLVQACPEPVRLGGLGRC